MTVTVKVKVERVLERVVEIAIYGLVFIIPFSKAGIEIFGITAIVGWVILKGLRIKNKGLSLNKKNYFLWIRNSVFLALAVFLTANLLSCITSIAMGHSLSAFFTKTLEYALFFIVIASVFSDAKGIKRLLLVVLVSTALCYINGLAQYFMGFDLVRRDALAGYRISGSLINPNDFGNYVIMFIPLSVSLLCLKKLILRCRILVGILLLISLCCLILSNSRASFIGFAAGISFFGYMKGKKFFIGSLILLLLSLLALAGAIKEKTYYAGKVKGVTIDIRFSLWEEALNIIRDYPITGAGLNVYTKIAPKYKVHKLGGMYAHNSYLQMAAETGIVGLTAFLWFVWAIFSRGVRLLRRLRRLAMTESTGRLAMTDGKEYLLILGLMAGILGFLVNAFFDTTLYALRLVSLFWVMMGILVALCNIAERKEGVKT